MNHPSHNERRSQKSTSSTKQTSKKSTKLRRRRKRTHALPVAPTLITLAGAACGFGAITLAAQGGAEGEIGQNLVMAALLVFAAIVFDGLDGKVARLTNQTSEFGKQLDSLCDAVSFGVAPAFIAVKFSANFYDYPPRFLWMIALLYMLCAIMRLARFNVETGAAPKGSFSGLPSPAAAGAVVSLVVAAPELQRLTTAEIPLLQRQLGEWFTLALGIAMPILVLATACLMVSRIRYPYFATQILSGRMRFRYVVKLLFAIAAIVVVHELAAPLICCYYVFESPLRSLWWDGAVAPLQRVLRTSPE